MTNVSKEHLAAFLANPEIRLWHEGVAAELKTSTGDLYTIYLMRYFWKDSPSIFLQKAQENPRQVALEVKSRLGELYRHSMDGAHLTKYALRSLLQFHEIPLTINGRIKIRRTRQKSELTWENADKIIQETDEPYRSIFTFMKWSGLAEDEFMEIQGSPEIQHRIEEQRHNDKRYIKIRLSPRKNNLDDFFTLAPKQYVPHFPYILEAESQ